MKNYYSDVGHHGRSVETYCYVADMECMKTVKLEVRDEDASQVYAIPIPEGSDLSALVQQDMSKHRSLIRVSLPVMEQCPSTTSLAVNKKIYTMTVTVFIL